MLHRHRWILQEARKVNWSDTKTQVVTRQTTRLLYVCSKCPEVKTREIDGHWTLEEILGRPKEAK